VGLRPIPAGAQLPSIDDVAHEIDRVGVVMLEEIDELGGLAGA
jgi:hypothetical protein